MKDGDWSLRRIEREVCSFRQRWIRVTLKDGTKSLVPEKRIEEVAEKDGVVAMWTEGQPAVVADSFEDLCKRLGA